MERATLDQILRTLRAHEAELKAAGVGSLRIFGSVARDQAGPDSDVDLEAVFEGIPNMTLFDLVRIERHLSDILERKVDLVEKGTFKKTIAERVESEAVLAF
jgi:predicted nucleotidyltransferase